MLNLLLDWSSLWRVPQEKGLQLGQRKVAAGFGDWHEAREVWELPSRARERVSPEAPWSLGGERWVEWEAENPEGVTVGAEEWLFRSLESRWCHRRARKEKRPCHPCFILYPVGYGEWEGSDWRQRACVLREPWGGGSAAWRVCLLWNRAPKSIVKGLGVSHGGRARRRGVPEQDRGRAREVVGRDSDWRLQKWGQLGLFMTLNLYLPALVWVNDLDPGGEWGIPLWMPGLWPYVGELGLGEELEVNVRPGSQCVSILRAMARPLQGQLAVHAEFCHSDSHISVLVLLLGSRGWSLTTDWAGGGAATREEWGPCQFRWFRWPGKAGTDKKKRNADDLRDLLKLGLLGALISKSIENLGVNKPGLDSGQREMDIYAKSLRIMSGPEKAKVNGMLASCSQQLPFIHQGQSWQEQRDEHVVVSVLDRPSETDEPYFYETDKGRRGRSSCEN